jgi:spermidine/putrescine-binding protein
MNTRITTNILLTLIAGLLIALVASPASQSASSKSTLKTINYLSYPDAIQGFPCGSVNREITSFEVSAKPYDRELVLCSIKVYVPK